MSSSAGSGCRALNAVTVALARAIEQHAPDGGRPRGSGPGATAGSPAGSDPMAVAGTLVAMYASVAAHRYGFEFWGIRTSTWSTARPGSSTGRSPVVPVPRVRGRGP